MWTLDTRIEITPAGRYVATLRRQDKILGELSHPGKDCEDPRVRRIAVKAEAAADNLRGSLHDELARCGALPLGPDPEEAEPTDRHGYPLDYVKQPDTCAVCHLCSIHKGGPSCFDAECPNPLPVPCECGHVATVTYFGRRFCWPCVDFMEETPARPVISREEMARRIAQDF